MSALQPPYGTAAETGTGPALYRKAKALIPGGTQLLSKRPELFLPEQWPSYYSRAQGVTVWDLDGRAYTDMSHNGIGACILGAADPDVDAAVKSAIDRGTMATLNAPEEVELAERLCALHPWAEQVRYARTGGEAMAIAVRIARACTGRDVVAFCGYHGWHDWYLAANLAEDRALDGHLLPGLDPAGVPRALRGTAWPFRYNHLDELEALADRHGDDLAAIIMEPVRGEAPAPGFLDGVRALADRLGAVLIVDECTAALRQNTGGAHLLYGLRPDVAMFAKGLSNGYPMAAVIGTRAVMEAAQDTFISSTYWTERIGPVAALATLAKHEAEEVPAHLDRIGRRVQEGWRRAADAAGLAVHVAGIPPLAHFTIDAREHGAEASRAAHTVFTQELLKRGYLAGRGVYATFAHTEADVDAYVAEVAEVFSRIADAMADERLQAILEGPLAHNGFKRLT